MHPLVAAPARAWNVFLACEDWKKSWTFWDAYMSLTWCSNMVQTQMKEIGYSFSLTTLYWLVWLLPLLESVFQLFFGFWIEVFSYCFKTETFAIGFQKWFGHEWIDYGFFLLENGFFHWRAICLDWNQHDLLICYSFLTTSFFSMFSLSGILVCSLNKLVLLSHAIL